MSMNLNNIGTHVLSIRAWNKKSKEMYSSRQLYEMNYMYCPYTNSFFFGEQELRDLLPLKSTGLIGKLSKPIYEGDILGREPYSNEKYLVKIGIYDNNEEYEDKQRGVGVYLQELGDEDERVRCITDVFGSDINTDANVLGNVFENEAINITINYPTYL